MKELAQTLLALGLAFGGSTIQAAQNKPNVLIIHTDEHNCPTLGCYRALMTKERGPSGVDEKGWKKF